MVTNAETFILSPNQQRLFKRSYALAIGAPNQTAAVQYANFPIPGKNNSIQPPSPLRVTFDIEKNFVGSSNVAKFQIYNMATVSRQQIKKGHLLQLQAGYGGLTQTLFIGNVSPTGIKTERKEADIIFSLECGDGEAAIVMTNLHKSYPAGSNLAQILQDIAQEMSLNTNASPDGSTVGTILGLPNVVYGRGISISGSCRHTLDKLLKPQGLRWSVQNNNLTILPATGYDGKTAILVSSETGMIGTPSNNGEYTEFISLLNPNIIPGSLVKLKSENTSVNGFYKVLRAHYEGDTHDMKWQVSCQCQPMPNIVQNLPTATIDDFNRGVA